MANFKEFNGVFKREYSEGEKQTYKPIYGDDESEWPGADDDNEGKITIDLDYVVAFNEYSDNRTTIDIRGGSRFSLRIKYEEFKEIMNAIQK